MHPLRTATALAAALALVILPACGDDDEDTTTSVAATTAAAPATSAEVETSAEVATSAEDTADGETTAVGTDTALEATTDGVPSDTEGSTDTAMDDTGTDAAAESPDEADVRAAIQAYLDAFVAQDGAAACDLLTPTIQDAFLEAVKTALPDADTCEEAFTAAAGQAGDAGAIIGQAEIGPITVEGDTATSSLQALGQDVPINLERIDGEWKIANLPGQ